METPKTCSFFGHRKIELTEELIINLRQIIEDLILHHNVYTFLFGSRSDFDNICYDIVTELKEKYPCIKRLNYTCKSEACIMESERKSWEDKYLNIAKKEIRLRGFEGEVEHKNKYSAGRASYVMRNYTMIEDSTYCIFYYKKDYTPDMRKYSKRDIGYYQPKSGTALAYAYANQKRKTIINLFKL